MKDFWIALCIAIILGVAVKFGNTNVKFNRKISPDSRDAIWNRH